MLTSPSRDRRIILCAAVFVFAWGSLSVAQPVAGPMESPGAAGLRLKIGAVRLDPTTSWHRTDAGRGALAAGARFVLQLDGPLTPARIDAFRAAGVELGTYLPEHAYIARATDRLDADALRRAQGVRWVGPFEPAWKLDPEIEQQTFESAERRALDADGRLRLSVALFEGEPLEPALAAVRATAGVEVLFADSAGGLPRIELTVPKATYPALAAIPAVQWIEEVLEPYPRNANVNWVVQSNVSGSYAIWNRGLTGTGQIGGLIDGNYFGTEGLNADHCSFRDPGGAPIGPLHRKMIAYFGSSAYDAHSTHTSGTFVGNEQPVSGGTSGRGVAYAAKLAFTNLNLLASNSLLTLLNQQASVGATVHSNSWGGGSTTYNQWCVDIDRFSYDNENHLVLFAVINNGVVRNPENSKNCLAVAASGAAPNQHLYCSGGSGPTADGRRRPEVMAPGCSTVSSRDAGAVCNFGADTGTSMACPAAAGAAILARQYFMEGFYPDGAADPSDAFTPSGALLKAVLINSAVDMTGIAGYPSVQEGWGRLLLENALYFAGDLRRLLVLDDLRRPQGLTTGQTAAYSIVVQSSGEPLKVTLVWTEKEAALAANPAYINDLDLEVTIGANTYFGNDFTGGQSALNGVRDFRNNTEQVLLNAPPAGPVSIAVRAQAVNTVEPQAYALVVTGDVAIACAKGDMNFDGFVNGADIQDFVRVLLNGTGNLLERCAADMNSDQVRDVSDVPLFVNCLISGGPCP